MNAAILVFQKYYSVADTFITKVVQHNTIPTHWGKSFMSVYSNKNSIYLIYIYI